MKVLICFNREGWDVNKEFKAIKQWLGDLIDIQFTAKVIDIGAPKWNKDKSIMNRLWVIRNLKDYFKEYDLVVLNNFNEDWNNEGLLGYADNNKVLGKKFIAMTSEPGGKRNRNRGWLNNNEFAGRLRHELVHILFDLTGQKDQLHSLESKGQIDKVLDILDFNILEPEVEFNSKPMLLCPIQNTAYKLLGGEWKQRRPVVTQKFGLNPQIYGQFGMDGHNGIDFRATVGTPVFASHDGQVTKVSKDPNGYGWHVRIRSKSHSRETIYAHLSRIDVTRGQHVGMGDVIGLTGNTGFSTGPHLHFGLRRLINGGGTPLESWKIENYDNGYYGWIDPIDYLITFKGTLTQNNHG